MKELNNKRNELKNLHAPDDFEERLWNKLSTIPTKKKRQKRLLIAVVIVCFVFTSLLNYPALAFYGKTLFGYEQLMTESIQQLNEEGYGQQVSKSIKLEDGTLFTVEGIMSDHNKFTLYYSIEGDGNKVFSDMIFYSLTGSFTNAFPKSGMFDSNVNKGLQHFDSVSAFAKNLKLSFMYENKQYELQFPYNASKAVPTTIKKQLNKTFTYDLGKVKFNALYATKASTRIEGTLKERTDRNIQYDLSQIVLVADGKELTMLESGMSSNILGDYKFQIDYAVLPSDVKQLAIEIHQFKGMENVKKSIPALIGENRVGSVTLDILSVQVEDGKTKIRIASDEDVLFDQVSVKTNSGITPLISTENYNNGVEKKERTLVFDTTDKVETLNIETVYYDKIYKETINIPIK